MHNEGSTGDGQWLSDTEQTVWRRWVTLRTDLQAYLNRSLQEHADLSISDYEVMVMLSDAECDCLRVSELARRVGRERSSSSRGPGSLAWAACATSCWALAVVLWNCHSPSRQKATSSTSTSTITAAEVSVYQAGGVLQRFAKDFLGQA